MLFYNFTQALIAFKSSHSFDKGQHSSKPDGLSVPCTPEQLYFFLTSDMPRAWPSKVLFYERLITQVEEHGLLPRRIKGSAALIELDIPV